MKLIIIAIILAGWMTNAHAGWGRCNVQDAKQTYLCTALVNCANLKIDPARIESYSDAELIQRVDELHDATISVPHPGITYYPALLTYETDVSHIGIVAALHMIVDIKSAPISDYACQASIVFDPAALHAMMPWLLYEVLLKDPEQNIMIAALVSKDPPKALQYIRTMTAVLGQRLERCIVTNPIYTPGRPISKEQIFVPGCAQ